MNLQNHLSIHVWTDWDYIDWFNAQIYSAHYDAWWKHQCEMMDEPTEEEINEANAHMLKRLGMESGEVA